MKVCVISDTHEKHVPLTNRIYLEDPDVIIHCGDAANHRTPALNEKPMRDFLDWYRQLDVPIKIFSPGNHDTSIEHKLVLPKEYPTINFAINETVEIEDADSDRMIKIFCSPYTPNFGTGWSYNKSPEKLERLWRKLIPEKIDILVTHGPPKGMLDLTQAFSPNEYVQVGCKSLLNRVRQVNPEYHCFGHIHDESNVYNSGIKMVDGMRTKFINASNCNLQYKLVNPPIFFEI